MVYIKGTGETTGITAWHGRTVLHDLSKNKIIYFTSSSNSFSKHKKAKKQITVTFYSNHFDKVRLLAAITSAQETPVSGLNCINKLILLYFHSERKAMPMSLLVASPNSSDEMRGLAKRMEILVCGSSVVAGGKRLAGKSKIIHNVTLHQPDCLVGQIEDEEDSCSIDCVQVLFQYLRNKSLA